MKVNIEIYELALRAGLIDHDDELPGSYFVHADIELEDIELFAESIIKRCMKLTEDFYREDRFNCDNAEEEIKRYFGIEQ